jgi:hypothetical protein
VAQNLGLVAEWDAPDLKNARATDVCGCSVCMQILGLVEWVLCLATCSGAMVTYLCLHCFPSITKRLPFGVECAWKQTVTAV